MSDRRFSALWAVLVLCACGSSADDGAETKAAKTARDSAPDGLYHDFLDGKYDGAGHPLGASVWEAESELECARATGRVAAEGVGVSPGTEAAGDVCHVASAPIALGRFTFNVRALVETTCSDASCDADLPVLELAVLDGSGTTIASQSIPWRSFVAPMTYQNASLTFTHATSEPVSLRVRWPGSVAARVDYVELFRSNRNLLVTPPSGLLAAGSEFQVEVQDPPESFVLGASCDDVDLTAALEAMLESGQAVRTDTDFRALFAVPAEPLLAGCALPARVRFQIRTGDWVRATSRVTIYDSEPECAFAPGTTRVLLTGFEPFPADSTRDNSSEEAVSAFDPASVPGISLMRLTLPVEFDTAPAMVVSAIERCQPDVVIGFGQGRSAVDLETTAYNLEDSSEIAGGVPDNRGVIGGGEPIVAGAPAELASELPLDDILARLQASGIAADFSDDPGRYVCNDLFYRIVTATQSSPALAGFVHLPRIPVVDDDDRAMLATVVHEAVAASVQAATPASSPP